MRKYEVMVILDPDTEEPMADGDRVELVFTSLTKEAMPVIRYRTRDLSRLLPGTARTMRRTRSSRTCRRPPEEPAQPSRPAAPHAGNWPPPLMRSAMSG